MLKRIFALIASLFPKQLVQEPRKPKNKAWPPKRTIKQQPTLARAQKHRTTSPQKAERCLMEKQKIIISIQSALITSTLASRTLRFNAQQASSWHANCVMVLYRTNSTLDSFSRFAWHVTSKFLDAIHSCRSGDGPSHSCRTISFGRFPKS